jgi:hypothetical protein
MAQGIGQGWESYRTLEYLQTMDGGAPSSCWMWMWKLSIMVVATLGVFVEQKSGE